MEELAANSDKRNKKLQREVDLTKTILGTIDDVESAEKAINRIRGQRNRTSQTDFGINRDIARELQFQQYIGADILKQRLKQINLIQDEISSRDVGDSMKDSLNLFKVWFRIYQL